MNTMTPAQVNLNRTARLVVEASTPTPLFVSTRAGERTRMLIRADELAGEEFCHICGRCTDHRGEHSDEQLERFARSRRGRRLMETW